jgi:hypothetical protein
VRGNEDLFQYIHMPDALMLDAHKGVGDMHGLDLDLHRSISMPAMEFITDGLAQYLTHVLLSLRSRNDD